MREGSFDLYYKSIDIDKGRDYSSYLFSLLLYLVDIVLMDLSHAFLLQGMKHQLKQNHF
jgi:hypothetical protein